MSLKHTPVCEFGTAAIDFSLPGVDGRDWSLQECRGEAGVLVMFICNHCPYVKAALDRIVRDAAELKEHGIHSVAVMSNDPREYAEDSFDNMIAVSQREQFSFPYLWDQTQQVARDYGAVCTPDFFGYNAALELQYRGRLDSGGMQKISGAPRELFDAMVQVAQTGCGPEQQTPSMGCSIKWSRGA